MPANPLDSVFYISVPENLSTQLGEFTIDPTILLPVELKPGETELDVASISWEMILSGMLRVLTHHQDHEHADYYRRFVQTVKPNIESELIAAGIEKAKLKQFDAAEELFTTAAAAEPASVAAHYNRALVFQARAESYRQLGKEALAEEFQQKTAAAYQIAIEKGPDSVQVLRGAAEFFMNTGRLGKALSAFESLAATEPSPSLNAVIEQLRERQRLDQLFQEAYGAILDHRETAAIELIDTFLNASGRVWNAWFLRGWAERRLGNFSTAEENFKEAYALTTAQPDLLNELAICTMETGNFSASRGYLTEALALEEENVKILSNLGILSLKEGNPDEALLRFRRVLELDPEDPIAKQYLGLIGNSA